MRHLPSFQSVIGIAVVFYKPHIRQGADIFKSEIRLIAVLKLLLKRADIHEVKDLY